MKLEPGNYGPLDNDRIDAFRYALLAAHHKGELSEPYISGLDIGYQPEKPKPKYTSFLLLNYWWAK